MDSHQTSPLKTDIPDDMNHSSAPMTPKNQKHWNLTRNLLKFTIFNTHQLRNRSAVARSLSYISIEVDHNSNSETSVQENTHDPKQLTSMVREKNLEYLSELGGVEVIALGLKTNTKTGLSSNDTDDLSHRKSLYGCNVFQNPSKRKFTSFIIKPLKGIPSFIQLFYAIVSIAYGIKVQGKKQGWCEGCSTLIFYFISYFIQLIVMFRNSQVMEKLIKKFGDINVVQALRDGSCQQISTFDVVVGDVIFLQSGDYIPADGLFLDGKSLKLLDMVEQVERENPFLLCGSKVVNGYGRMLVTSVGNLDNKNSNMPLLQLQVRLKKIAFYLFLGGLILALLIFVDLVNWYFTGRTKDNNGNREFMGKKTKCSEVMVAFVKITCAAVPILVIAFSESLPLAVTLFLSCSMKAMSNQNILIRNLSSWDYMGSLTVICTDKSGIIKPGEMSVSEFWVGTNKVEKPPFKEKVGVLELLHEAVGLNTSCGVYQSSCIGNSEKFGCSIEKAILKWGISDLGVNMDELNKNFEVLRVDSFDSVKRQSGILIRKKKGGVEIQHYKGAAEVILDKCSTYFDRKGKLEAMTERDQKNFRSNIKRMRKERLTCIAFAQKEKEQGDDEKDLSLLGVIGLRNPLQPNILEALGSCRNAGVSVKLITGDNYSTAKAIAAECGILNSFDNQSEAVIEGIEFRNYSDEERLEKVDRIKVMASASPEDKLLMIRYLKQKDHVVAINCGGTNNTQALDIAHVGILMGTESASFIMQGSYSIVIVDGNFRSIVTILKWERCMFANIQHVIQVQVIILAVGFLFSFIVAITSGNAVPLLWGNMMVDTMVALILATEQPSYKEDLMRKTPKKFFAGKEIGRIGRNIIGQTLYQLAVLLTLQFTGKSCFGVNDGVRNTIIFSCFVFCQLFNSVTARKLKKNICACILENKLFWGTVLITFTFQIVMVELLCKLVNTIRLSGGQWAACFAIAALSWPVRWLVKFLIPV
ncbi:unnamed protein product [Amaranthus hypochondriacus]